MKLSTVLVPRPDLSVAHLPDGGALVFGASERFLLPPAPAGVLRELDGARAIGEIVRSVAVSEAVAHYLLSELRAQGLVVEAHAPEAASLWPSARARDDGESVQVVHVGCVPTTLGAELGRLGLSVRDDARTIVVVCDDYLNEELAAAHADWRARGVATFTLSGGRQPWLGPLLLPGDGPCWTCLTTRIRENRPVEEFLVREGFQVARRRAPRILDHGFVALGAAAIARSLAAPAGAGSLAARLQTLDWRTGALELETVVRRPQCATCGAPERMKDVGERPVALRRSPRSAVDGGFRGRDAARAFDRVRHQVGAVAGAVTYVQRMPGKDPALGAVYVSGYRACPRALSSTPPNPPFDKTCAGKGRTDAQARMSAVAEAIERWSGLYRGDEARVRASARGLGEAAIHPDHLQHFSARQVAAQQHIPAAKRRGAPLDAKTWAPLPLAPDVEIDWTPGWSLTHGRRRWVPLGYCYAEAPPDSGVEFVAPSGNGVAAGACLEEAVLQGMLELVERDAVSVWWYNRLRAPRVAIDASADPFWRRLDRAYGEVGFDLWMLDLTHDLGIPVCAAVAHSPSAERFALGFGCHLSLPIAAHRALTELHQIFDPAGPRADWQPPRGGSEFLAPTEESSRGASLVTDAEGDLAEDIQVCLRIFERLGLECVVVDKSRPDVDLAVAQVIVPPLRHFWPRFAPGRLYDVPIRMGARESRLTEPELNPVPLFL